jgi:ABC-type multidrug transport system ATPase subunit
VSELLVELVDTSFRYGRRRRAALQKFSLEVRRGEVVCLIGPNGAGKTTALRAVAGLMQPTHGHRRVAEGITLSPLFDRAPWIDGPTVDTSVRNLWAVTDGGPFPEARLRRLSHELGLQGLGRRRVGDLSLGVRQRLGVLSALLHRPDLLVLDEPFGPLDPTERMRLGAVLVAAAQSGTGILLSSHDLTAATACATRVESIVEGRNGEHLELISDPEPYFTLSYGRHGNDRALICETVAVDLLPARLTQLSADPTTVVLGVERSFASHATSGSAIGFRADPRLLWGDGERHGR